MGVASLVLGILAIIVCWVPCVGWCAIVPGILGIILGGVGIAKAAKKGTGKGCAVAGLVMSIIATAFSIFWVFVIGAGASAVADGVLDAQHEISQTLSGDEQSAKSESTAKESDSLSKVMQTAAELNEKVDELKQSKKDLGEAWSRLTGKGTDGKSELGKAMDAAMDEAKESMKAEATKAAKEALKGLW